MSIHVRDACLQDAELLCTFNCLLAEETEQRQLDRDVVLRGVRLAFGRPQMCRYFIAEINERPLGQCMVTYEWSDWRAGVIWWFQSVYVDAEFRRRGVFRALYEHVHKTAHSRRDVCGLRLYVEEHNQPARRTYERLGMSPSGHTVYELDWSAEDPLKGSKP